MRLRLFIVAGVFAALSTACLGGDTTEINAVFDDAGDLTVGHAVKVADVTVGKVESIDLTKDYRARVRMSVGDEVTIPADVTARLRKTNLLGERFVELVPGDDRETAFKSGDTIRETTVVPELEEVVASGTDVLVAVAADTLAGAIESGSQGLDGRGETFGEILTDLNTIVDSYDDNSDDLVRLVDGFDRFLADTAPQADMHGRALAEVARFTETLEEEDEHLIDTLVEVQDLAVTGTDIIKTHRRRFDDFFVRFDGITDEVVARDADFERLIHNAYRHNRNTIRGINRELAQVFFDFIVCGVNDDPGDPVRDCTRPPQTLPRPKPRPVQDYGQSDSPKNEDIGSGREQ